MGGKHSPQGGKIPGCHPLCIHPCSLQQRSLTIFKGGEHLTILKLETPLIFGSLGTVYRPTADTTRQKQHKLFYSTCNTINAPKKWISFRISTTNKKEGSSAEIKKHRSKLLQAEPQTEFVPQQAEFRYHISWQCICFWSTHWRSLLWSLFIPACSGIGCLEALSKKFALMSLIPK